ncbi:unnamed protein product, partial [Polarella glacialis]
DAGSATASATTAVGDRVVISGGSFKLNGKGVVLMGGNYVFKTQPFFPDASVVRANAKMMAAGAAAMAYEPPPGSDGQARSVKACVRLGATMDGAMPNPDGRIDPVWAEKLEATIKAFGEHGVHVFLDAHQDNLCTTSGGEGFPYWYAEQMQKTAGCFMGQCCCCCCLSSSCCTCSYESCQESYIASPTHP